MRRVLTAMIQMKKYLALGGGKNSVALLLLLTDEGGDFETFFINHGGDYPETYEYIDYLRNQGFDITEIIPDVQGCKTILEYCYRYDVLPLMKRRWCTERFKIREMRRYVQKPCELMIGISYEESRRCHVEENQKIINSYPLVEMKITRKGCIDIIKNHGLKAPQRSHCFFCPFMKKKEARELYLYHPELYQKVIDLEHDCGKSGYYLVPRVPFNQFARADIPPLTNWL